MKKVPARELWNQIAYAAWRCADPGTQYNTTINEWHTCPEGGPIRASNPCSEYMFLDNTACNLASANLMKFYDSATNTFDVEGYEYNVRLWTVVLEISVLMAQFPSKEVAQLTEWAAQTDTGDQGDLTWSPSDQAWRMVSVGSDENVYREDIKDIGDGNIMCDQGESKVVKSTP